MNVMQLVQENAQYIIDHRRYIHQHPETGWNEVNTSKYIQAELDKLGIPYVVVADIGLVGKIQGVREKPVIGLRCEMDALPVTEDTGLPFASVNEGVMHACGHDGHMAMLLGAAKVLSEHKDQLNCTVKLIFQPAEESITGAKKMLESSELDDVDNYMSIHNWPSIPVGKISVQAGTRMASCDMFYLTIKGEGGHGAFPESSVDPIVAGSAVVGNMQSLVSRELSPGEPAVVSICTFNAGNRFNIIPNDAEMSGTTRLHNQETRKQLPEKMERIIKSTCEAFRAKYEFRYDFGTPPVINDAESSKRAERAVVRILGADAVYECPPNGAEDFAYYLEKKPGYIAFVGSEKLDGKSYPLHHEKFDMPDATLLNGAALFAQYVLESQDEI